MPKLPVLNAKEAESILLANGFMLKRIKGSHHIYFNQKQRVIITFHAGKSLHPKIVKEILDAIATK